MTIDLDKRLIQNIQRIGQDYDIEKIVLFGSRARGDNKPKSDIDLAIFPLPEFSNRGLLTSDFDDLDTLLKIDVVIIEKQSDPKLLRNIEREGVILYERSKTKIQ
ncbi:nucleotidyltransferase domain-containing protein [Desulfitobacterium metallireducens]|uniref:DNA polymerase III subunit beta n=1 Tax=Desulfitobacterium metallireducens DSM 15288 TaxID=871968 RepID=W0EAZ7_9FIRM|nr:nucleotidyltransferase domain-containing protein [Desulfitobacterium metallireducens]AHF08045.1 DNA polymerase III subunit beta [Desulfitobacterium metallireducens DSM 15288]